MEAKAKNAKCSAYIDTLKQVYDVMHTTRFPRRLIGMYAKGVERELDRQLSNFAIPYRIKVNENFGIEVHTDKGMLPRVSGGQEMVIGLCLRLALHTILSHSFPMLIIDEGTTHLDAEENKPFYFQMLSNLKSVVNLNQIIIVDHDRGLQDVVDHVIAL
jgi:DNA repair exonuclease SbcCD ATPase subunit